MLVCFGLPHSTPLAHLLHLVERESELWDLEGNWLTWTEVPAPGPSWVHPHVNEDSTSSKFD